MATEMVTLPLVAITDIRRMLVLGLASLAEIERLDRRYPDTGPDFPDWMRPVHPSGRNDEASNFAAALLWLENELLVDGNVVEARNLLSGSNGA